MEDKKRGVLNDSTNLRAAEGGGGRSSLDLWTLTDTAEKMDAYGIQKLPNGRPQWCWTIKDFEDGSFTVTGAFMEQRPYKASKKPKKPRSTIVSQMSEQDIQRTITRTKQKVTERVKMMKANQLITCTTRRAIVDADEFKVLVQMFLRKMRRDLKDFRYVAVFERHMSEATSSKKFGSLHLHMAVAGFVSYNLIRKHWRDSVQSVYADGDYEGANIDASGPRRKNGKRGSPTSYERHKLARYLSKYVTKDIDNENFEVGKRRYWSSKNIAPPKKTRLFTCTAMDKYNTFKDIFSDLLGVEIKSYFSPDVTSGATIPIIYMSTH